MVYAWDKHCPCKPRVYAYNKFIKTCLEKYNQGQQTKGQRKKMVKLFNYANAFLGLLICICKIQENECSLCKIEVNGYGNDDPNGRQVYFKLNNEIAYIRAEFLGNLGSEVRGFHLAFVNIRNCSLIIEPVVCDTFYQAAGSNCVVNYIGQYSNTMEDVFLLLATGKGAVSLI